MAGNMELYEKIRNVPQEAKKAIGAGRLKGMTDINPMWRIKTLTEQFGACGIGWYFEVTKQWIEEVGNERVACVNINLYIKSGGEWSKPIFGTGGSKLSTMEKSGLYVSDECYKMATTDAISVACKNLGMGANVYWEKDRTKYDTASDKENADKQKDADKQDNGTSNPTEPEVFYVDAIKIKVLKERMAAKGVTEKQIFERYNVAKFEELTVQDFMKACSALERMADVGSKQVDLGL